ncbi:MAG: DUF5615 family PIN-like protein [Salinarimonas sp.]
MRDTILVDECLSVGLVALAKARGIPAVHAAHIGKGGWQDWNLVPFALENDFIVATNNRRHFLKEYLKHDLHNGVIIVVPNVERDDQLRLFTKALDLLLDPRSDITNKVIEVLTDGTVHVREWTREQHDLGHIAQPQWGSGES